MTATSATVDGHATGTGTIGSTELPWVLVWIGKQIFALDASTVQEMVSMPDVCALPQAPPHVRGVINLRGRIFPVVDLRTRFGMESHAAEIAALVALLEQREQDHRKWLAELEASVREHRAFTLTTDPHACAFGRWYDTFHTDNLLLDTVLKRFDEPHRRIHAVGRRVVELAGAGDVEAAQALIEQTRTGVLSRLVVLFADAVATVRQSGREIAVVIRGAAQPFAAAVDGIESVERLTPDSVSAIGDVLPQGANAALTGVARRAKSASLVLMLQSDRLLDANDWTRVPDAAAAPSR